MGDGKSVPGGGKTPEGTRLESAEDIRRALAGEHPATVVENAAKPAVDCGATRLESAEDIRRAAAPRIPTSLEAIPVRSPTRVESAADVRQSASEGRAPALPTGLAPAMPAEISATVPFRPARRPPIAILVICDDGDATGETIRLRSDRTVLGRSGCDVNIPHDGVMSSRHAEIVREAVEGRWRWQLVDLQSTNGTFVRVASASLKHGTSFLVGSTVLRFDDAALNLPGAIPEAAGPVPTKTQGWKTLAPTDLKASLVPILPEGIGPRFFLDAAEQWVGRDNVAIKLSDDVQVDAQHAKIVRDAKGNWTVVDAGSKNGVWLRVERHEIDGPCEFQLGEQRFVLTAATASV